MPRILSIVAPANGSGKTSLLVTLLRARPGAFAAVKASTVYRDGRHCPREGSGCACRRLKEDFTIITDPAVIVQAGTDTGRMAAAGAARTLWCLCRPGFHDRMWSTLEEHHLLTGQPVLVEGGGVLDAARPEAIVMVASPATPREAWKESARSLAARAALVVVNRASGLPLDRCQALAGEIASWTGGPVVLQDVAAPLESWSDRSLARIVSALCGGDARGGPPGAPRALPVRA